MNEPLTLAILQTLMFGVIMWVILGNRRWNAKQKVEYDAKHEALTARYDEIKIENEALAAEYKALKAEYDEIKKGAEEK